jgi:predicted acetyltransferase
VPDIELERARPADRGAIENLFQLYTHDFSEQWWDRPVGELNDDGRFDLYPLDVYWEDERHTPLLLRLDGRLVGFALINDRALGGRGARNIQEFFVVRKHRRGGVGTAAAHAIFSSAPGPWEAAIARRNIPALAFWRKAVSTHPRVSDIGEIDLDDERWNGLVLRFNIRAAD